MNNTTTNTITRNDNANGYAYGIIFTIGVLLLVMAILLACAKLCRRPLSLTSGHRRAQPRTTATGTVQPIAEATTAAHERQGIDDETLESYPKLLYSQVRDSVLISCAICLDDYKQIDLLRRLPDCGHLYHLACIDSWLKSHRTCPLCRTSPSPVRSDSPPGGLRQNGDVAVRVE